MENGLYIKLVMIHRRDSYDKKEKDKTKKYNYQGKSARIKHQFNLDHEWLKGNFMTREPYFYRKKSN